MTFGEKLKKLRVEQHLTQEQIAEYVGISRRAYISYEQNNARPRKYETFQKLAQILKCDVRYLSDEKNFISSVESSFIETMATVLISAFAPFPVRAISQVANAYSQKTAPTNSSNSDYSESVNQVNKFLSLQQEKLNQFRAMSLGIIASTAAERNSSFLQIPLQRLETFGDKPEACAKLSSESLSSWWFIFWTEISQIEERFRIAPKDRASMLMARLITMEPDSRRKTSIVVDDSSLADELQKLYKANSFRGNLTVILVDCAQVKIVRENLISTYSNLPEQIFMLT